jgi:hypothetical protein
VVSLDDIVGASGIEDRSEGAERDVPPYHGCFSVSTRTFAWPISHDLVSRWAN